MHYSRVVFALCSRHLLLPGVFASPQLSNNGVRVRYGIWGLDIWRLHFVLPNMIEILFKKNIPAYCAVYFVLQSYRCTLSPTYSICSCPHYLSREVKRQAVTFLEVFQCMKCCLIDSYRLNRPAANQVLEDLSFYWKGTSLIKAPLSSLTICKTLTQRHSFSFRLDNLLNMAYGVKR